jgi:hypothetical protein
MGCIMKTWFAAAAAVVLLGPASTLAQGAAAPASVPAPALKVGDAWVVETTTQKGTAFSRGRTDVGIERLGSDNMVVTVKQDGAASEPQSRMMGLDWAPLLLVDGEQKATSRPLSFPLQVGKSWTADWVDSRRLGNQVSAHVRGTYKVVGWEDVTVPAGTFHALKIEESGIADADVIVPSVAQSTAVGAPGAATAQSRVQQGGRSQVHVTIYSAIYYAPEVKRPVKTVDEQYNAGGVMTQRHIEEIVSFKLAG